MTPWCCWARARTSLPVNADFQNGYADEPDGVARNVKLCVETGVAGLSIEDATGGAQPLYQLPLAPKYSKLSEDELRTGISRFKQELGKRLVILGHHYQQDDVIRFADFTGDSLKLSMLAAQQTEAEFIVFCGVHFMAESADVLTSERQTVILPDLSAGCSMADMAQIDQVEEAWERIAELTPDEVVPITYVNSSAAVKAFVGGHGGACCTSSNARSVLEWAVAGATPDAQTQNRKVMFFPDQHLGRNTAYAMGWPLESMVVWDPRVELGGLSPDAIRQARFVLWKGHCSVHQLFTSKQIDDIRRIDPEYRVIVHPECDWSVVQKADPADSDQYFATRPRASQIGAWASAQSRPVASRTALLAQYESADARFAGQPVPRPDNWGGYVLSADAVELWMQGSARLHDRAQWKRELQQDRGAVSAGAWTATRLQP